VQTHPMWRSGPCALGLAVVGVGLVTGLLGGPLAGSAFAGAGPRERDRRIAVGGITVTAGEAVDGPLIGIDGRAQVAGSVDGSAIVVRGDLVVSASGVVDGDVVVIRGDATVNGRVDGDVVVIGGRALVGAVAVVRGDVRSTDTPRVARSARVGGNIDELDLRGIFAAIGVGILVFWWMAVTVSTAVLGVIVVALFPRILDTAAAVGRDRNRWWHALLVGLGLVIGLPIVGLVAASTVVGLPFGLGVLGALGLLHALGYVTAAHFVGRLLLPEPRNRFGAFFSGWAILRGAAVLPGLGILGWLVASLFGTGMLAVTAFRAGKGPHPAERSVGVEVVT
jgi:cytoskeletal protein CcmA (bactofilin family)